MKQDVTKRENMEHVEPTACLDSQATFQNMLIIPFWQNQNLSPKLGFVGAVSCFYLPYQGLPLEELE